MRRGGAVTSRLAGLGLKCLSVVALGATFYGASSARADILVNVSKSQQKLEVIVDGAEAFRWPVSTGRAGHATPSGNFRPHFMARHWYSRQYGRTPMPYAVFFHRGYAVHGTMESYNLGRVASHGCVRLRPDNAAILYWLVRKHGLKNTKVVVMNGPLPKAPPSAPQQQPPQVPPQGMPVADVSPAPDLMQGQDRFAKVLAAAEDKQAQQLSAKIHDEPVRATHRTRHVRHAKAASHRKPARPHRRVARDEGFLVFGRD